MSLGTNELRFDRVPVSPGQGPKAFIRSYLRAAMRVFHRPALARQQSSYNRHWQLSITLSSTFAIRSTCPSKFSQFDFSTQSTATRGALKDYHGKIGGFSMNTRPNEAAIDEIVASCNGDIRGALRALLLVNEQLEAELQQLHAVVAYGGLVGSGSNVLH
jgi:hypothetical protein